MKIQFLYSVSFESKISKKNVGRKKRKKMKAAERYMVFKWFRAYVLSAYVLEFSEIV